MGTDGAFVAGPIRRRVICFSSHFRPRLLTDFLLLFNFNQKNFSHKNLRRELKVENWMLKIDFVERASQKIEKWLVEKAFIARWVKWKCEWMWVAMCARHHPSGKFSLPSPRRRAKVSSDFSSPGQHFSVAAQSSSTSGRCRCEMRVKLKAKHPAAGCW